MHNPEIHIILLWHHALSKKEQIVQDIEENYKILEAIEVQWSKDKFYNNMSRFYGIKLDSTEGKVSHCGNGDFLLITLLDDNPHYDFRITSRGTEYVNTNIFDLKNKYRSWTGGGHKIHTTNNIKEVDHNLALLLGSNYQDYFESSLHKNKNTSVLKRDLTGSDGWKNLKEIFYTLNSCCDYVVLRNFSDLPFVHDNTKNGDIDLLVTSLQESSIILNSKQISVDNNNQFLVHTGDEDIIFDLNSTDDDYSIKKWKLNFLDTKSLNKNNIYVPSEQNHFFGLLYHIFFHKDVIHKKNFEPLIESYNRIYNDNINVINLDDMFLKLCDFLNDNNYHIENQVNRSTFFDKKFSPENLQQAKSLLSTQSIKDIKPFLVRMWKNGSGYIYFQAQDMNDTKLFVKFGGVCKSAEREFSVINYINNKHFPKAFYFRSQGDEKFIATNFIIGESLDQIDFRSKSTQFKKSVLEDLVTIINVLHEKKVIHRDIKPNNLILDENGKVTLIDFQFVVGEDFAEMDQVRRNPGLIENLGEEYKLGHYKWDDAYSIMKIACEIDNDFQTNHPSLFHEIDTKIGNLVYTSKVPKKRKSRFKKYRRKIKHFLKNTFLDLKDRIKKRR